MIKKKANQAVVLIKDYIAYFKIKNKNLVENEKNLYVNFENPQLYHRFFYLLLKFYKINGYNIYYPLNFSKFRNLRNKDQYLALIVKEKKFLSLNKRVPENCIELNDEMFSTDYFSHYFEKDNIREDSFHVPMSFHPLMYHRNIWNIKISSPKERYNALLCYGNFDVKAYSEIKKTYFKVASRVELIEFFSQKLGFAHASTKEEITLGFKNWDKKYVFITKDQFQIKMNDVREILSYFNFYLCCPGVVMPLCHNIVEAMSVGTIPIIEKEYAEVMYPNLEHKKNAIIFNDLNDLEKTLAEIFNLPQIDIELIRRNVLLYYEKFLSPQGMIKNLNHSIIENKKIYLQAEHRSVKF